MTFSKISQRLQANGDPKRAAFSLHYFPLIEGEDRNGADLFYGGTVPSTRTVAKEFSSENFDTIKQLFGSNYHEEKLCGLMILKFQLNDALKDSNSNKISTIKSFYLDHIEAVNHWDLVDESASSILGRILVFESMQNNTSENFQSILSFADPNSGFPTLDPLINGTLWHKRISIVSQFAFIKAGNLSVPLSVIQKHIDKKHHYIQKACGWVLREIGKNDKTLLDEFLIQNIKVVHSICLSYALEKHTKEERSYIRSLR